MLNCEHCNKTFSSIRSLNGHLRIHNTSNGKLIRPRCCCIITKREISADRLAKYQSNIKYCLKCGTRLGSNRKFCNRSCAAIFNNIDRVTRGYVVTDVHKHKVSISISNYHSSVQKFETNKTASGGFSKLYMCKCRHCNAVALQRKVTKYCSKCVNLYSPAEKQRYKFTFNVYDYPDLFDLSLIDTFGWFSPNKFKKQKWNPDGISRDHRVSVYDALRYNYDAFYITHPLNCELMRHNENNKKKTKSSIEYSQLVKLVENYIGSNGGTRTPIPIKGNTID